MYEDLPVIRAVNLSPNLLQRSARRPLRRELSNTAAATLRGYTGRSGSDILDKLAVLANLIRRHGVIG